MGYSGRLALALVAAAAAASLGAGNAPAAAAAATATGNITVVHGLRGVVADVYVDGQVALQGFAPERTAGPLPLPAGPHDVAVTQAGAPVGTTPVLSDSITIPAAGSISAVAHLGAQGQPNLTVFTDDLSALPAGQSRLVMRHTAQVGEVVVVVDGTPVGEPIGTADEEALVLPPGAHQVLVRTADGQSNVLPEQAVTTTAGQATIVYLIGSAQDDSLAWLLQEVTGLGGSPTGVPTGNSGLAAPQAPDWLAAAGAVSLLVILLAGAAAALLRWVRATSPA